MMKLLEFPIISGDNQQVSLYIIYVSFILKLTKSFEIGSWFWFRIIITANELRYSLLCYLLSDRIFILNIKCRF